MLMERWDTIEERAEQLRRYQLCLEEFAALDFHDNYVAQIKQDYQQLTETVKVQPTPILER
ncbi:hypothetical protein [Shewanella glacialipiscicola]|nr:hypothetical protein [Shewanella glacialipiscicola]MCL1085543.1 hypothetical protein [Shewanella glacialipiscicola]MCU7994372.1 hypothetical protein [Shewanella glacialipiscicola]MCU8025843.1 hypothetical protein [Shewanella glacialipiscicola]